MLKVQRNSPCPCGSGKKFKKCCGSSLAPARPDVIAINKALAYRGAVGRRREAFCRDYIDLKRDKITEMGNKLRQELVPAGQVISCGKGCVHCCKFYVDASLQECEAIVYHLYQHDEALRHFLAAFDGWRDRIQRIERCFRKLNNLTERSAAGLATEEEKRIIYDELVNYSLADIPCPFLAEGACSIYEVRPYVCAGLVATTPQEWCNPAHPNSSQGASYKVSLKASTDMPYFAQAKSNVIFSSLPFLVHRILEEGYDALSAVPGLEGLKELAFRDPEVRVVLADMRLV